MSGMAPRASLSVAPDTVAEEDDDHQAAAQQHRDHHADGERHNTLRRHLAVAARCPERRADCRQNRNDDHDRELPICLTVDHWRLLAIWCERFAPMNYSPSHRKGDSSWASASISSATASRS